MKKNILMGLLFISWAAQSVPQGEVITYQGELIANGQPANGLYNFVVDVYDDPFNGNLVAFVSVNNVNVDQGLFTLDLDYSSFNLTFDSGEQFWFELTAMNVTTMVSETLSPRQQLNNAPYALNAKLARGVVDNSITSSSILNFTITGDDIANHAIDSNHIINFSITKDDMALNAVDSGILINGSVTQDDMANDSIGSNQIINGSVGTADIATGAVTQTQLGNDSVGPNEIATAAVRSDEVEDGSLTAADVDTSSIQRRISGNCPAGSSIRNININGTVDCETDDAGTNGWALTGNVGTTAGTQFIGTTDDEAFVIKSNNHQAMHAEWVPNTLGGNGFMNLVLGDGSNYVFKEPGSRVESVVIMGETNVISTTAANRLSIRSAILGGVTHWMKDSSNALIAGGFDNDMEDADFGVALGGFQNQIKADYAFASGYGSKVNHRGGWVWNDASDFNTDNSFATTDAHQFLVRATGGIGLGTNAPASPIHIKGQGTSSGSVANSDEVVMTIEPDESTDDVAVVINKLDASNEGALMFSNSTAPEFDIRSVNGGALDFNSYESGSAQFMMRINDSATSRVDFNANVEPQTNGNFDFGSASFRWRTLYSVNPLDSSSDERLKKDIKSLDYGLAEIIAMRPVSYGWKHEARNDESPKTHLGLIAQEVEQLIPEVVSQSDDESKVRSMRYAELIPVLIKATQEQQILIEQQQAQIKMLTSQLLSSQNQE